MRGAYGLLGCRHPWSFLHTLSSLSPKLPSCWSCLWVGWQQGVALAVGAMPEAMASCIFHRTGWGPKSWACGYAVMIVLRKCLESGYSAMVSKNSKFLFWKDFSGHLAILLLMPELPLFPLYLKELSHTEYFVKQDGEVLIKTQNNMRIPLDMSYQEFIFTPPMKEWLLVNYFLTMAVFWLQMVRVQIMVLSQLGRKMPVQMFLRF